MGLSHVTAEIQQAITTSHPHSILLANSKWRSFSMHRHQTTNSSRFHVFVPTKFSYFNCTPVYTVDTNSRRTKNPFSCLDADSENPWKVFGKTRKGQAQSKERKRGSRKGCRFSRSLRVPPPPYFYATLSVRSITTLATRHWFSQQLPRTIILTPREKPTPQIRLFKLFSLYLRITTISFEKSIQSPIKVPKNAYFQPKQNIGNGNFF